MDSNRSLNSEQLTFIVEHQNIIDALRELATSDEFIAVFGEMSVGEVLDRYEMTLAEDDEESRNVNLRQRYEAYQQRKDEPGFIVDDDDDFSKLEARYRK